MTHSHSTGLPFLKMHGLGNDFVVLDLRGGLARPDAGLVARIADRHRGVGFDQLAAVEDCGDADARLVFWNADGSLSSACGNATRCIARWLMDQTGAASLRLRTDHGMLLAEDAGGGLTRVNMGPPVLDWRAIPLARDVDIDHLPIAGDPVATGMGNPHVTFFVDDADAVDLDRFGPEHEHHPLYPERTNVEVVQVLSRDAIRLRIWERGTGPTLASGSCSCAAVVAAARRGLTDRRVTVHVPGGQLLIDWREDGVWMEGPTAIVFEGRLTPAWLA
ncbi:MULTISPECIES: diaminopimelate epimerase [Paracoccus]|uniref:Diaminopimelate epimerase n=1 Tax=Paracoccus haeundaensis TaxID=225362 RepID=A0A5C4R9Q3_9RHOB|nr:MULTISPECIES: diaminopimelate epimerase [Paracoccus]KIX17629.1 diaminopimelate epimerase [Paracoccus sp. 228]MBF5079267.1 diaminopimelate epimerase [Paracoccus sp. NBH48]TNH40723.1 diaminopimelate epimerase [Paracoccus haeundaensis]|tara:strand:+ start:5476 stop:6303 length:828 start_codon:yes stop_codon:yes gene_type:complete